MSTANDRRGWPSAVLRCGNQLHFRSVEVVPSVADVVPCSRHGYCRVDYVVRGVVVHRPARRCRRGLADVETFLRRCPNATAADLRRARFSLRLIDEAVRAGLVAHRR